MPTEDDFFLSFHVFVIKKILRNLPLRPLDTASFYKSQVSFGVELCFSFKELSSCLREEGTGQFEA